MPRLQHHYLLLVQVPYLHSMAMMLPQFDGTSVLHVFSTCTDHEDLCNFFDDVIRVSLARNEHDPTLVIPLKFNALGFELHPNWNGTSHPQSDI